MDKGTDFNAFSDIKEADSLRSVDFVSAGAHHINPQLLHINGKMSIGLHRICVE